MPRTRAEQKAEMEAAAARLSDGWGHHQYEKRDGTGYPRGLRAEQIPPAARLFAVVDVWDALRSDRPYRLGWSEEKMHEHIRSQAGTHFDPQMADFFARPGCALRRCGHRRGQLERSVHLVAISKPGDFTWNCKVEPGRSRTCASTPTMTRRRLTPQ